MCCVTDRDYRKTRIVIVMLQSREKVVNTHSSPNSPCPPPPAQGETRQDLYSRPSRADSVSPSGL